MIGLSAEQVDPDQVGDVLRPWMLGDLGRRAGLDQVTVLHDDQAIGERDGLERVVRHDQADALERVEVALEVAADLGAGGHVERRQRLVEQQKARVGCERTGQRDALALAA